jgi:ABC-type Fe3+/spermidine/putrescine transport system ATPase subunit
MLDEPSTARTGHSLLFDGVTHRYGSAVAVQDVTLDIRGGELVSLLGPSGCDKTTLLREIGGFIAQSEGRIVGGGESVDHLPPDRRSVGIVFQNYALFPHMTAAEPAPRSRGAGQRRGRGRSRSRRRATRPSRLVDPPIRSGLAAGCRGGRIDAAAACRPCSHPWRRLEDRSVAPHSGLAAQIERGLKMTGVEVARALETSLLVRRALARFFAEHDLLISPPSPTVAWPLTDPGPARIGGVAVQPRGHAVFTPLINHALAPAISIPCGRGRDGLPVGLQIIAPRGADHRVLAFARAAEAALAPMNNYPRC